MSACSYKYPGADRLAFQDISLRVTSGEIVLVRGRNGSGKSTLLKVMSGELKPTRGTVVVDRNASAVYMAQSADEMLAFDLTVREHLSAFPKATSSISVPVGNHLKAFGIDLDLRLDEFVGHLSGGQRQIIALLTTIESGSNLLCLDEFLSALDAKSVQVAADIIRRLVTSGNISVVAVSHSPVDLPFDREITLDKDGKFMS